MIDDAIKILLIGMNGQVGRNVLAQANQDADFMCVGVARDELDILNHDQIVATLKKHSPDYVINCAAYTDVEKAESDQAACEALNVTAVASLAKACHTFNLPLLHLSTDYVFNGKKNTPYTETDKPAPLSVYGMSKWHGEQQLIKHHDKYILLRVSAIFSPWRTNFVKTIVTASQTRKELRVINDQQCCPTGAGDVARVLLGIIKQLHCGAEAWGTYHYVSADMVTWYDFAQAIVTEAKKHYALAVESVTAISSEDYAAKAPRPKNSVLDCQKILNAFGIQQRSWEEELAEAVKKLAL